VREEFAGKTGLIVGGSSGIGKTVGRILLERGAEAVIIVGKNEQKLRATEYRYLNLNRGTFFITQHVARNLAKRGRGGAIVNIGSMWAKQACRRRLPQPIPWLKQASIP
jgi:NAD(P)-dependent dehydrogenase (short-subunit alcohol dehydrogenase family)